MKFARALLLVLTTLGLSSAAMAGGKKHSGHAAHCEKAGKTVKAKNKGACEKSGGTWMTTEKAKAKVEAKTPATEPAPEATEPAPEANEESGDM